MLIDTHCHLNFDYENGKTTADLVREASEAGVGILITIGTEHPTFKDVQKISESFPNVYHTIGVHPHDASTVDEAALKYMRPFLDHPKCVAVGEIGLDYYYEHSDRAKQQEELRNQLSLALEVKKPVIIHSRDGEEDLLPILKDYASKVSGYSPGVIHCFSGTENFALACIELGFYISFSGILTFKNSQPIRDMAAKFPRDRVLVETDSPFLAPVPMRGKKCEPAMVKHTAEKLAEIWGISFEALSEITTQNALKLFQLLPKHSTK